MNRNWLALLLLGLLLGCSPGGETKEKDEKKAATSEVGDTKEKDEKKAASEVGDAATLKDIAGRLSRARRQLNEELRGKSIEEQGRIQFETTFDEFGKELLEFANKAQDTEDKIKALKIAARNCLSDSGDIALQRLIDEAPVDLSTLRLIRERSQIPSSKIGKWFKDFETKASEPYLKAQAIYYHIQFLEQLRDYVDLEVPSTTPQPMQDFFDSLDEKEIQSELDQLVERLADDFMDRKLGRRPVADIVEEKRFIRENLSIGKVAPEIVGKDLDGVEFKLSDYRGKVVMLDFWGDW